MKEQVPQKEGLQKSNKRQEIGENHDNPLPEGTEKEKIRLTWA